LIGPAAMAMDKKKEAILYRKKDDEVRARVAMRGQALDLVRHVMTMPPKTRGGYFILEGELQYHLTEISRLAKEYKLRDPWGEQPTSL
jgi:hypothetical protein